MSAILNSLNAHNFLIFQPILMRFVSKFMVYRGLSDMRYLLLGLRPPLKTLVKAMRYTNYTSGYVILRILSMILKDEN